VIEDIAHRMLLQIQITAQAANCCSVGAQEAAVWPQLSNFLEPRKFLCFCFCGGHLGTYSTNQEILLLFTWRPLGDLPSQIQQLARQHERQLLEQKIIYEHRAATDRIRRYGGSAFARGKR
jgi:hypothetical protein